MAEPLVSVRVDIAGGDVRARFDFAKVVLGWADNVIPVVVEALRRNAPVGSRRDPRTAGRPHLRDRIRGERLSSLRGVLLRFTSDRPYTRYVLEGTRPHEIRPRVAPMLAWLDDGGDWRFARVVQHPGTTPNRFERRAWAEVAGLVEGELSARARRGFRG